MGCSIDSLHNYTTIKNIKQNLNPNNSSLILNGCKLVHYYGNQLNNKEFTQNDVCSLLDHLLLISYQCQSAPQVCTCTYVLILLRDIQIRHDFVLYLILKGCICPNFDTLISHGLEKGIFQCLSCMDITQYVTTPSGRYG